MSKLTTRLAALGLSAAIMASTIPFASAVTKDDINALKNKRSEVQSQMSDVQSQIDSLQGKIDSALEQAQLYQQQMGLISDQIADTQAIIDDYSTQIEQTQAELEEAQAKEEEYYELYCERFRDLEETGNMSYLSILFEATSFHDFLDKLNFVKDVAEYDNGVVDDLEAARQEVADKESQLEEEKSAQETAMTELESQQSDLQTASDKNDELIAEVRANQSEYQDQLDQLDAQSDELDDEIAVSEAEYEAQVAELKRQAEEAEKKRKAEEEAKKKAEEEAKKKAETTTSTKTDSSSSKSDSSSSKTDSSSKSDSSSSSSGSSSTTVSGSGAEVASYACQFIGNPYVWGGTSLTNGCDCSGFVMQVYKHFGISLAHSSYSQRSAGRAVSYSEAQPGDIIFYYSSASASGGHIGIYIGGGQMVSARGVAYGIGVTSVNPNKSGFTVRRLIG